MDQPRVMCPTAGFISEVPAVLQNTTAMFSETQWAYSHHYASGSLPASANIHIPPQPQTPGQNSLPGHVREEGVEKQRALIRKSPGWLGQAACNLSTCWVILARFLSIPKASLTGSRPGLRRLGSALPPKAAVPLLSSSLVLLRSAQ